MDIFSQFLRFLVYLNILNRTKQRKAVCTYLSLLNKISPHLMCKYIFSQEPLCCENKRKYYCFYSVVFPFKKTIPAQIDQNMTRPTSHTSWSQNKTFLQHSVYLPTYNIVRMTELRTKKYFGKKTTPICQLGKDIRGK